MSQSRAMSLVESATSVVIGYIVAVVSQLLIYPIFGFAISMAQSFEVAAYFTVISWVRGYYVRRFFNSLHGRV